jgi:glycine/D-amino acid oxidase-like deaminating enzyme
LAADVIVVGAGVAGAGTAYALAKAGAKVLLLEAERPGFGASGRNPGFLWMESKPVGPALEVSLLARRFQETLGAEIGDFGFRASGGLTFFRDPALRPRLAALAAQRSAEGMPMELLDAGQLRERCPALDPTIAGSLWCPLDAHQDTRRLVSRLVVAAEAKGATADFPRRVTELVQRKGRIAGVALDDGTTVEGGTVVLAASLGALDLLAPLGLKPPLRPVRYEAAETAPAPFALEPVLCGPGVLAHIGIAGAVFEGVPPSRSFTHQAAQYPDGRIQYGSLVSDGVDRAEPTAEGQSLADATWRRDLPQLAALPVERRWAGIVAQAPDYLPFIDLRPGIDGLALNCGHSFGNILGAFSGAMVASALTGSEPPFSLEPFALSRFPLR